VNEVILELLWVGCNPWLFLGFSIPFKSCKGCSVELIGVGARNVLLVGGLSTYIYVIP